VVASIVVSGVQQVAVTLIRSERSLQVRAEYDKAAIEDYEALYRQGGEDALPPLVGFRDSVKYVWLADGFHRYRAARNVGLKKLPVEIKPGSKRDAILYAAGANATHGVRRTAADKRRAVIMVLDDPEWRQWTDKKVAEIASVSSVLVGEIRDMLYPEDGKKSRTYNKRDGTKVNFRPRRRTDRSGRKTGTTAGGRVSCPRCGHVFSPRGN